MAKLSGVPQMPLVTEYRADGAYLFASFAPFHTEPMMFADEATAARAVRQCMEPGTEWPFDWARAFWSEHRLDGLTLCVPPVCRSRTVAEMLDAMSADEQTQMLDAWFPTATTEQRAGILATLREYPDRGERIREMLRREEERDTPRVAWKFEIVGGDEARAALENIGAAAAKISAQITASIDANREEVLREAVRATAFPFVAAWFGPARQRIGGGIRERSAVLLGNSEQAIDDQIRAHCEAEGNMPGAFSAGSTVYWIRRDGQLCVAPEALPRLSEILGPHDAGGVLPPNAPIMETAGPEAILPLNPDAFQAAFAQALAEGFDAAGAQTGAEIALRTAIADATYTSLRDDLDCAATSGGTARSIAIGECYRCGGVTAFTEKLGEPCTTEGCEGRYIKA